MVQRASVLNFVTPARYSHGVLVLDMTAKIEVMIFLFKKQKNNKNILTPQIQLLVAGPLIKAKFTHLPLCICSIVGCSMIYLRQVSTETTVNEVMNMLQLTTSLIC